MTDRRDPGADCEEPPLIAGMLGRGSRRVADPLRRALVAVGRRTLMALWAATTLTVFVGFLLRALVRATDLGGVLSGVFVAFIGALAFAGAVAWLLMWALAPAAEAPFDRAAASELEALLAPTLRELDTVRAEVIRQVKERSVMRVPAGAAGAAFLWLCLQWGGDPPVIFELVVWCGIGAFAGEVWAAANLAEEYTRLYKSRVLPVLAARFGDLTYRRGSAHDVHKLQTYRILDDFDSVNADDEIAGTHRGLPIRIVELRLDSGSGDDRRNVFDGLLIDFVLPRSLTGTTVVVADAGLVGNLKARWRSDRLQRVRLEDPRFAARYEVYSSDQIEARALLTPAFMERFTALAELSGFALPGAWAEGNRLVAALPKLKPIDLFEPPVYWKPTRGRVLLALSQDIEAVLEMADAVIDLDFWARGRIGGSSRDSKHAMRAFLLTVAATFAGSFAASSPGQPAPVRTNVVFFLADDLGQRDLGCYGSTFYETPNLDRLAREGAAVHRCLRGVPGLLADAREHHDRAVAAAHGHHRLHRRPAAGALEAQHQAPARALHRPPRARRADAGQGDEGAGYATFFAGKWHLGPGGLVAGESGLRHQHGRHRPRRPLWRARNTSRPTAIRA